MRVLLVVAAASGAGKTTLLAALLPRLRAAGLRVAVVKRTHDDVDLDVRGKDTSVLREAGADPVILAGPGTLTLFHVPEPGLRDDLRKLGEAVAALAPIDLLLVEGGRELEGWMRIELAVPGVPLASREAASLLAVVGEDVEAPPGVARHVPDDVEGLARRIVDWVRGR